MTGKPKRTKVNGNDRWYVDGRKQGLGRKFFETKEAADDFQAQVNRTPILKSIDPLVDRNVTLEALGDLWLEQEKGTWRPSTHALYSEDLKKRILPCPLGDKVLGDVKVRDIGPGHVERLVRWLASEGFAPNTIRNALRIMSTLLERAVSRQLLTANPISKELQKALRPFTRVAKANQEPKAFSDEQRAAFLAIPSPYHDMYVTGFATGLRPGELAGLQFEDYQGTSLRIERTLLQRGGTGPTKTGAVRHVDVGTALGALLTRIKRERVTRDLRGSDFFFVTASGRPVVKSIIVRDFKRCVKAAGLPENLTPHSMRHSFACWHIAKGRNAKWLQQQMGHSSITMTLDLYGGWFKLHEAGAADDLAASIFGNSVGNNG